MDQRQPPLESGQGAGAEAPLRSILRRPKAWRGKRELYSVKLGQDTLKRPFSHRFKRRHILELEPETWKRRFPYKVPFAIVSPLELGGPLKRFYQSKGKWVPTGQEVTTENGPVPIPGIPKGLELLAVADHLYIQQATVKEFPETLSTQLGPEVVNRYQVICGDTRNRLYYGIAEYPACSGCLFGYRPFKLYLFSGEMDLVLCCKKGVSSGFKNWWCFGGIGTEVTIKSGTGQLYGKIRQTFNLIRPTFALSDEKGQTTMKIKGPPIIPRFLKMLNRLPKFKLFRIGEGEGSSGGGSGNEHSSEPRHVGTYLESSYGPGTSNLGNALRIGFPRDLPIQQKGIVLASLFLLYITYYELGDEFRDGSGFRQDLRPLRRINPLSAPTLTRPYGNVRGKCNPFTSVIVLLLLGGLIWLVYDNLYRYFFKLTET